MDFITKNIWFILFVTWGLPLSFIEVNSEKSYIKPIVG